MQYLQENSVFVLHDATNKYGAKIWSFYHKTHIHILSVKIASSNNCYLFCTNIHICCLLLFSIQIVSSSFKVDAQIHMQSKDKLKLYKTNTCFAVLLDIFKI